MKISLKISFNITGGGSAYYARNDEKVVFTALSEVFVKNQKDMKLTTHILLAAVSAMIWVMGLPVKAEGTETAVELIRQAHKHDSAYTLGDSVDRQKALSLYSSALTAEPDDKQRLHILYRMAQLYGTNYQRDKGEGPDYHRAIELYKEIVRSYPPGNHKAIEAMLWVGGHYAGLQEFEDAVEWFKKVLEYDTDELQERLEILQGNGQDEEAVFLKKTLDKIKRLQVIAVDNIANSAERIDLLRAHGELRHILTKYSGTFIAHRAHKHFVENIDKTQELWAPQNDDPFAPPAPVLQVNSSAPAVSSEVEKAVKIQSQAIPEKTKRSCSVEPNSTEIPQKDKHTVQEPRAPPQGKLLEYNIIGAVGLVLLCLAAIVIRNRKNSFKELENEDL